MLDSVVWNVPEEGIKSEMLLIGAHLLFVFLHLHIRLKLSSDVFYLIVSELHSCLITWPSSVSNPGWPDSKFNSSFGFGQQTSTKYPSQGK